NSTFNIQDSTFDVSATLRSAASKGTLNSRMVPNSRFWSSFGPGLLWAAAAIGVSHLVQSTRAGAVAGFGLAGVILLALVIKYPFFEYGPRYAAATGSSLVEGYLKIGKWALWLYFMITLAMSVIIQSAVVMFTAFLVRFVFGLDWSLAVTAAVLIALCALLLWMGRYKALDAAVKIILVVLAISTLIAAAVTLPRADLSTLALWPRGAGALVPFAFILALMGWMPSAFDIAVWNSLWTLAKDDASGQRASVRDARLDFFIGYAGTGVLAFAFVMLGAGVMFASGESFSPQGTVFSTQLVDLYSQTLGAWTRPIVSVAVLTTMVSTTLTVMDGFPRAIERSLARLQHSAAANSELPSAGKAYWYSLIVLAAVTVLVLALFIGNLTTMVDFATIVSFLTAPILGYLNLKAITSDEVAPEHRPGRGMLVLSWVGMVVLVGFGAVYVVSLFS
ncbi:MAG: divalent metal cation transporter, partial [Gemmatimonadota bacterium]